MLYIGRTYNTGNQAKAEAKNDEIHDSDEVNYYVQTHIKENGKNYNNQQGIVQFKDQECMIVSSNTRARSASYNPWED